MKILYVANDRNPAQLAANALRTLAEDVSLEWAGDLSGAASWVYYNRDVAAVVVETALQNQSCAAFVDHVRSLGLAVPVIVVCPDDVRTPLLALKTGADDYVANNQSLLTNLPGVVARALQRVQATAHPSVRQPLRLLYVGDAALARRCLENSGWSIEIAEAERTPDGTFQPIPPAPAAGGDLPFDVLLVEHDHPGVDAFAILEGIAGRHPNVRVILVVEWDEKLAIPAMKLGASDCVVKAADTFRALFFKLDRTGAEVALLEEGSHLAAEEAASRERLEHQVREARATALETQRRFDNAAAHAVESGRIRRTLEEKLAAAEAALAESEQQRALAAAGSADHLAKRSAEYRATLAQSLQVRDALTLQLSERTAALDAAQREMASEAASAAERLALREDELRTQISGAVAVREGLEQRLAELEAALEQSEQRRTLEAAASAERLAKRGAELTASLGQAIRARDALERRLSEAASALAESEAARQSAEERATAGSAAASKEEAERHATLEQRLVQEAAKYRALEEQRREAEQALDAARRERAAESAAAADRLARREAELNAALEQELVDAEATLEHVEMRASADRAAASKEATERHAALEARLVEEAARYRALDDARQNDAAAARAARAEAEQRHASELATATAQLTDRQASHDAQLAQANQARVTLQKQLAEVEAALEKSERLRDALAQQLSHASATLEEARQAAAADANAGAERFRLREAELGATISEVTTARNALETQLTETEHALQRATQRAAAAELASAQQAAQHQAECEALRAQEAATRTNLGQALAEADAALQATGERHASELATARVQLAERQAHHDAQLAQAGATRGALEQRLRDVTSSLEESRQQRETEAALAADLLERAEAELGAALAEFAAARDALAQQLADASSAFDDLEKHATEERLNAAREASQRQIEFDALVADHAAISKTLERASAAHAAERARLDGVITERDAQLSEQAAMHQASQHADQQALTQIEEKLRLALETSGREMTRFQNELSALRQELDLTRRDRDTLRTQADRLPQILAERDQSRADYRQLFERSPVGQFRCNRDGTLEQVNRALVGLVGYRTGDELRKVNFATTVFESADDLQWLIERCLNTGTTEIVETTWRRRNNRRIVVKLAGVAASPDSIDIVVEDITEFRELEERLRRAHQMEAVGRLASEVAATCNNLLRDVSQDGQQWLAAIHGDTALRHQGEMLLGEVTRAASFLRQLAAYGNQQSVALGPVNVQRILRDLQPVLKRVVGDNIELALPNASPALNVEVEPERVERVLVNVASYARERMPHGGRLNIELATVIVDRRFLAKHPNVRPGDHVLITITELTGTVHAGLLPGPLDDSAAASRSVPEKPGVDLGALLSLVGDCGGHLWMSAEPPGNMVLKIHLPRPASDGQQDRRAPVPRPDQRRTMARWFRA